MKLPPYNAPPEHLLSSSRKHRSASREGSAPKSTREPARRRAPASQPAPSENRRAGRSGHPFESRGRGRPAPHAIAQTAGPHARRAVSCLEAARNHTPSYQHIRESGMARCNTLPRCRLKNNSRHSLAICVAPSLHTGPTELVRGCTSLKKSPTTSAEEISRESCTRQSLRPITSVRARPPTAKTTLVHVHSAQFSRLHG